MTLFRVLHPCKGVSPIPTFLDASLGRVQVVQVVFLTIRPWEGIMAPIIPDTLAEPLNCKSVMQADVGEEEQHSICK